MPADIWAWIYSRQGRHDDAQEVTLKAADEVEPARFGSASPEELSVWCGLLQRGVMVASRKSDAPMVDDLISLASAVGRRIGEDRIDQWTVSGPTNVAMHAVRSAGPRLAGGAVEGPGERPTPTRLSTTSTRSV